MLLTQQSNAKDKILPNKVGALFMKMGTGKTRVAVELVNAVKHIALVVWIGPLRTIYPNTPEVSGVMDEINKWGGFNCLNVLYIGIETIQSSDRQYAKIYNAIRNSSSCFIVVDESIKIKNFEAKRTKRLLELGAMCEYKLILNGEPITRNLLDLWSQIQFLSPKILGMDLAEFKDTFCCYTKITKQSTGFGRTYSKEFITGYENIDYLYSLIGEYVFECDLELQINKVYEERTYQLDEEAKKDYYALKEKYLDNEMLQMRNNNIFLEMTQKMQHIYCCSESKFEQVSDWLKSYPEEKTIIYCKYVASREECKKRYPKAMVLSYQANAYGLNLQHLPYTVFFDKNFDYNLRIQSTHRNYRTGTNQDVKYLDLTGNVGLEDIINQNIKKKQSMSEYFKNISRSHLKKDL